MGRTLIVSHRLPFNVVIKDQDFHLETSVGGLATGLMPLLQSNNLWLGWSGSNKKVSAKMSEAIHKDFTDRGCIPIEFSDDDHHPFMDDMCNGVIWPLYHYQVGNLPLQFAGWDEYVKCNKKVADAIARVAKPGDLIWIHDYHFQLVPEMLRERNLDVKIGFFLHIPFPAYEMFRILPWRKEILKGLLGADLIGFHTQDYLDHFIDSVDQILNADTDESSVTLVDRTVQLNTFPLGVDPSELSRAFDGDNSLAQALHHVREEHPELKIFLSVDRLDYTKGLARKLLAFEYLLENNPSLRGKLMLVQIAPPSRGDVPAYKKFRRQLDEYVGRINGKFSTPVYQPIFYLTRSFHPQEIYQVYKDVDVMLVTPVRDGMNLVAKEFIASRDDDDGVLVLSEFAGASSELHEALMINPYDICQMAQCFKTAVAMPKPEREARMRALRERVIHFHTADWAKSFLDQLSSVPAQLRRIQFDHPKFLARDIAEKNLPLEITLDYDGTLFPIVKVPASAVPDQELRELLKRLSERSDLHIVSGRPMRELKSWFAGIAVHLHAEHGAVNEAQDSMVSSHEVETIQKLSRGLQKIAGKYAGTRVETKLFSCCFHYRNASPQSAERAANEAQKFIEDFYPDMQVLNGKKTVEARYPHLNKGVVIHELLQKVTLSCIVAIGDDRTDEDMFQAVPDDGFTIVVGAHASNARYRLKDSDDVRSLLAELCTQLEDIKNSREQSADGHAKLTSRFPNERSADFLSL
ncbi:MAG: bifunctional alpha,alpha-trehalose-phosphate synthase (UDP-forming)/trehalose-phosphatase [Bdellovibrionota bacterium]